ncbi:hypothetical protein NKR23_g4053 [Pleurostoma richardsiae]|uniref:Zn(2)-C6 fungal-type domain-containing protein n=1 Tax=Pleurostoma richardsiae TaxID=41990 RepID=A0AA38RK72_9PEZI|nr:hypothetical protein NKR23_g4053 [Pleurostoma richardsiae]
MSTMVFEPVQPASASTPNSGTKTVKRPRPVKSCNSCRQRKLRCDRTCPCSQCQKSNRVCKYANEQDGSEGSEPEASPRPAKRVLRIGPQPYADGAPMTATVIPVQAPNGTDYRSTSASSTLMEQFGARLERLERMVLPKPPPPLDWSSSRHHHHHYPHQHGAGGEGGFTPVAAASPGTIRSLSVIGDLRTRFFGQNSTRVLVNLFPEAKEFLFNGTRDEGAREIFVMMQKINWAMQEEHRRALSPITVFIDSMVPVQKRMADILPKRSACDRLLESYLTTSEGLYRVIHIPSFRQEYDSFWQGKVSPDGFLPRLLCMLSVGARFEAESRGMGHDRGDGIHVPTACALVRAWLDSLRGRQLIDMNMLQTEILLLHAQRMIAPRNQEAWTQLGLIVRMAMTMGLHRDPSEFPKLSPFSAEIRRRIWYTIMDMDLHVALACNLPCAVREGEYTCQPPSNIDDEDLLLDMKELPPPRPIDCYTNNQMQAFAASTLPYRLRVAAIINRLDALRDFTEVLECGASLERTLDDINHLFPRSRSLDPRGKYKEWRMRALLDMHVRRPLLSLYRPFALGTGADCPPHIAATYLKSSMTMLTYMDELDPAMPGFADVNYMYHVVLKYDIVQAAFSVCYFIKAATEPSGAAAPVWDAILSQEAASEPVGTPPDGNKVATPWSTMRMGKTVEKSLASLVALVKDSVHDLRDVVALSAVLDSVQGGSPEQKLERMKAGVRGILDACMQALKATPESIATLPMLPSTPSSMDRLQTPDAYLHSQQQFAPTGVPDDFSFWDMEV